MSPNGFRIDSTPPTTGKVDDHNAVSFWNETGETCQNCDTDKNGIGVGDRISASWHGCTDEDSGILGYHWGVGTAPGLDDLLSFHSTGLKEYAQANVTLLPNVWYYSTVICTNVAGLRTNFSSDGIVYDTTKPICFDVKDGKAIGKDIVQQTMTDAFYGNFDGQDFLAGRSVNMVVGFEIGVGTKPCCLNIAGAPTDASGNIISDGDKTLIPGFEGFWAGNGVNYIC